jgi:hypothetical protein
MSGRALLPLVARPKALALVGLGIAATLSPLLVLLLTEVTDATERAGTALLMAGAPLGLLGCACGIAVKQAAWCTFSWTMPRFGQRLRNEFLAVAMVLALVASLLAMLTVRPAPGLFPLVLATSLAALAVGCASTGLPESRFFPFLPALLYFAPWRRGLEAAIERPLAFAAVAAAIASAAIGATFATRTFRWANSREVASPAMQRARFWLDKRRATREGTGALAAGHAPRALAAPRLPYADTPVRRMLAIARATGPMAWLTLLAAGLLMGAVSAVIGTILREPSTSPIRLDWVVVGMIGFMHVLPPSQTARATLPWSRRDHLAATWHWHVTMALWYALVACPMYVAVTSALESRAWTMVDAARIVGSTLLLFPAGWWIADGAIGRSHLRPAKLLLLVPVFQWGGILVGALLSALVPAPHLQLGVLGVLVASSQALHWVLLKRYFAGRDLVGASG